MLLKDPQIIISVKLKFSFWGGRIRKKIVGKESVTKVRPLGWIGCSGGVSGFPCQGVLFISRVVGCLAALGCDVVVWSAWVNSPVNI